MYLTSIFIAIFVALNDIRKSGTYGTYVLISRHMYSAIDNYD